MIPDKKETVREEVHKEFQVERMILFSDAVFAIVVTLMAIELRLPDTEHLMSIQEFLVATRHLFPVFIAYVVSFIFIGSIWYTHLKLFAVVKSFDKGLVIRNLILLFCVGLFPFGATVIGKVATKNSMLPFYIYMGIIISCLVSQIVLTHYLIYSKPELRSNADISLIREDYKKKKYGMITMGLILTAVIISNSMIKDQDSKYLSMLWFALTPLILKLIKKFSAGRTENV